MEKDLSVIHKRIKDGEMSELELYNWLALLVGHIADEVFKDKMEAYFNKD